MEELEHGFLEGGIEQDVFWWGETSALVCGRERTPMSELAFRCDLVCCDLYDLCLPMKNHQTTMSPIDSLSAADGSRSKSEQERSDKIEMEKYRKEASSKVEQDETGMQKDGMQKDMQNFLTMAAIVAAASCVASDEINAASDVAATTML